MKPISLDVQRFTKYIPMLNSLVFAMFLYNHSILKKPFSTFLKSYFYVICAALPFYAVCRLLMNLVPTAQPLLWFVQIYAIGISSSHVLIKIQEAW